MRVAGPFGCRCQNIPPCSGCTSRSSNRTCGFAASGSPTGFPNWPTAPLASGAFTGLVVRSAVSESLVGGLRQRGHSPDSRSLPEPSRSQAPSLHRHYPASTVVRACPPPRTARPVPRGHPVDRKVTAGVSRVASDLPVQACCRHYPGGTTEGAVSLPYKKSVAAAFPIRLLGRLPHQVFRGLLGVHSRYGLPARGVAHGDPFHRRLRQY